MAGGHSRYPQNLSLSQLLLKVYAKLHGESRETSFFRAALILTTIAWRHRFLETQRIRLRANRNFTWRNRSRITNHSRSNPSYRAIIDRELENIEMSSSRKYLVIRDCSVFEPVFYPQNVIQFHESFENERSSPFSKFSDHYSSDTFDAKGEIDRKRSDETLVVDIRHESNNYATVYRLR